MDLNLWCEFHDTHGHRIGDCQHFREEVAILLKNGHLREFLSDSTKNNYERNRDATKPAKLATRSSCLILNMIFGGAEVNGVMFRQLRRKIY